MTLRRAEPGDADALFRIFRAVIATGDTYVFAPGTSRDEALEYFLGPDISSWVAEIDGAVEAGLPPSRQALPPSLKLRRTSRRTGQTRLVVGMYKLIPNRRDRGSHVANASFMVDPAAQGQGVGRAMGEHCLAQARQAGYQAMQFNLVISTNTAGVALWEKLGFSIVGTVPKAFQHARLGLVDAYVMHRFL